MFVTPFRGSFGMTVGWDAHPMHQRTTEIKRMDKFLAIIFAGKILKSPERLNGKGNGYLR